MDVIREPDAMRCWSRERRARGQKVGFVPTMGCLHAGHTSLVERAAELSDAVVLSVFVNPTQFGAGEDFERYPRDDAGDSEVCRRAGVDALFLPSGEAMYAADHSIHIEEERLTLGLCGALRPGHFNGVLTVVCMLLNIVQPDLAVFGRKDAQQAAAVRRMVRDLHLPVSIDVGPIIRECDGLALSSRNRYLDADARERALSLYAALKMARHAFAAGEREARPVLARMRDRLERESNVQVEYVALVDAQSLDPLPTLEAGALVLVAARIDGHRLIDNVVLGEEDLV